MNGMNASLTSTILVLQSKKPGSVNQFFYPEMGADEATVKRINIMLQSLNESELRMVEGIIRTIKESRKAEEV